MPSNTDALRSELVAMLLNDRSFARQTGNASAATAASTRVVDLMLGKLAEEVDSTRPVATVSHVLVHQFVCVRCREQQLVDDATLPLWTPPSASAAFTPAKRASAWDEPEEPPEPAPAPKPPEVLKIPKLPGQGGRRERQRTVRSVRGIT